MYSDTLELVNEVRHRGEPALQRTFAQVRLRHRGLALQLTEEKVVGLIGCTTT